MAGFWGARKQERAQREAADAELGRRADAALVEADERLRTTADELLFAELELGKDATRDLRDALEAVRTPGTELDGTEVAGSRRGVRGLWVELRHRRRRTDDGVDAPAAAEEDEVVAPEADADADVAADVVPFRPAASGDSPA